MEPAVKGGFFFDFLPYAVNTCMEESKQKRPPRRIKTPKPLVEGTIVGYAVGKEQKVIDPVQVEKLAALGCNAEDIARFFGVHDDTLRYNFRDQLIKGKESMKITLRRAMLDNACKNMNAAVQIFLAKNILGMSDDPNNSEENAPLPWRDDE